VSSSPSPVVRLEALDAWRGICASLVALEHLSIQSVLHENRLIHFGYRFVDFFFVLSGFVIAHAYGKRLRERPSELWMFLHRRVGRLWPLHATILLAFVVFEVGVFLASKGGISIGREPFTERHTLPSLPANVFLVQAWNTLDHSSWNVPSWSISTEIVAYAVFGLLCVLARNRGWVAMAAAAIMGVSLYMVLYQSPLGMSSTFDNGIFRCLYGFMLGALTREVWERWKWRPGTIIEIAIVLLVLCAVMFLPGGAPAVIVTPIFAFVVWAFASADGSVSAALRRSVFQKLGAWSYSIYMVHSLIALIFFAGAVVVTKLGFPLFARIDDAATIVGPRYVTEPIAVIYLALVIVIARFTYERVELPGQRLWGRFGPRARR
jgi:peptidoglycan/LPS O-acetylase OafA/YrhL